MMLTLEQIDALDHDEHFTILIKHARESLMAIAELEATLRSIARKDYLRPGHKSACAMARSALFPDLTPTESAAKEEAPC